MLNTQNQVSSQIKSSSFHKQLFRGSLETFLAALVKFRQSKKGVVVTSRSSTKTIHWHKIPRDIKGDFENKPPDAIEIDVINDEKSNRFDCLIIV